MPIAVEAVSPEAFAAWIASKGGTMPGAAAPAASGADATDDTATPVNTTVPSAAGTLENSTVAPAATNQAATANTGAGGNPGR